MQWTSFKNCSTNTAVPGSSNLKLHFWQPGHKGTKNTPTGVLWVNHTCDWFSYLEIFYIYQKVMSNIIYCKTIKWTKSKYFLIDNVFTVYPDLLISTFTVLILINRWRLHDCMKYLNCDLFSIWHVCHLCISHSHVGKKDYLNQCRGTAVHHHLVWLKGE